MQHDEQHQQQHQCQQIRTMLSDKETLEELNTVATTNSESGNATATSNNFAALGKESSLSQIAPLQEQLQQIQDERASVLELQQEAGGDEDVELQEECTKVKKENEIHDPNDTTADPSGGTGHREKSPKQQIVKNRQSNTTIPTALMILTHEFTRSTTKSKS